MKEFPMRLLKLLRSALVAMVVLGAALSTAASAAPVILPSEAAARTFTGKSDGTSPLFETVKKTKVTCEAAPAEGTEEANGKPLGLFHIKFEKCKGEQAGAKVPCTGLGEATEVVLVLGTWHLWYDSLSPSLGVATVLLVNEVHATCPFIIPLLFKLTGSMVCLDLEPTVTSFKHLFHCTQVGGKPDETKYWNETGVEQIAKLITTENDSTEVESAVLALGEVLSTKEVFTDNV
jgi:hypothetical protein